MQKSMEKTHNKQLQVINRVINLTSNQSFLTPHPPYLIRLK